MDFLVNRDEDILGEQPVPALAVEQHALYIIKRKYADESVVSVDNRVTGQMM